MIFQRFVDVFMDAYVYCRAYIDDVVFSDCWSNHCTHLDTVLQNLQDAGLAEALKVRMGSGYLYLLGICH